MQNKNPHFPPPRLEVLRHSEPTQVGAAAQGIAFLPPPSSPQHWQLCCRMVRNQGCDRANPSHAFSPRLVGQFSTRAHSGTREAAETPGWDLPLTPAHTQVGLKQWLNGIVGSAGKPIPPDADTHPATRAGTLVLGLCPLQYLILSAGRTLIKLSPP